MNLEFWQEVSVCLQKIHHWDMDKANWYCSEEMRLQKDKDNNLNPIQISYLIAGKSR